MFLVRCTSAVHQLCVRAAERDCRYGCDYESLMVTDCGNDNLSAPFSVRPALRHRPSRLSKGKPVGALRDGRDIRAALVSGG
jgi:hypothetical protein